MNDYIKADYNEFISYKTTSNSLIHYIENDVFYDLFLTNGAFKLTTSVSKTEPKNLNQINFEDNYKADTNNSFSNPNQSFSSKELPNGKKLFKRVKGVKHTLSGDTAFEYVVPYDACKVNAVEILWAPKGLMVDLKVYDTPTGTISTVPNYMLNQFGFTVAVSEGFHREESSYDADLIKDLKLVVTVLNPNNLTDEIAVNFIIHEVK